MKTRIYFWLVPKLFMGFLLLNAAFIIFSYRNYENNRYYQTIYSLTNAVLNLHYKFLPQASYKQNLSLYVSTWPNYIGYAFSNNGIFSKKLVLDITTLQGTYFSQTYREVRKRIQEILPDIGYGKKDISICYKDLGFCIDFSIDNTNRIYLYLLFAVASLFIAFIIPVYFAYTEKLLKPYLKMKMLADNLGIEVEKHSLFTPFFMQNAADLMVKVSDKVQKMLDDKLQLISALSHDFKTPLAKAKLYMQNMIPEAYHHQLLKYYADMEYLINQMNAYSEKSHKIEAMQPVNLVDFIDAVCHEYEINGFAVKFESTLDSAVLPLQRKAFKRAVQNIIDNAIKYAQSVNVTIIKAVNGNAICLRFIDEGPGVDPAIIDQLCEPFFRVDNSRSHNLPGSGLGLSIVKEIVEHNAATLTIYNNPNKRGLVVELKWRLKS
ncbi:sensor histidine kinase [Cysteiniphilum litorale]|uniref:sensor histidine kinase n=1 Tax=Cysteiniphilum litorale TaxID=2056700 RepID=UPI003F881ECF